MNPSSPLVLSLNISWPLHYLMKLIMMKNFLIQFMLLILSLIRMLAPSIEANIEEPSFYVSLEGDFSSCDTIDEKEISYGDSIYIYDDPITDSFFSKYPILDSEIHVPHPSHFVHTSLIDGAQPSDF